jgi:hypothetical protein
MVLGSSANAGLKHHELQVRIAKAVVTGPTRTQTQISKVSSEPAMRPWHRFIIPILSHFRVRRGGQIKALFPELHTYRILDLGGSVHFWHETGLIDHIGTVDIYNVSHSEIQTKHIATGKFRIHIYDGQHLPVADHSYDLVISNSVFEHIPPQARAQVAREARRVGRRGFIQTPAKEFLIEPHFVMPFIHWLPRGMGRLCVRVSPWALLSAHPPDVQDAYWNEVQLLSRNEPAMSRLLLNRGQ